MPGLCLCSNIYQHGNINDRDDITADQLINHNDVFGYSLNIGSWFLDLDILPTYQLLLWCWGHIAQGADWDADSDSLQD